MTKLLTVGAMLGAQARLQPGRTGARDLDRALTFREWNARACRLAQTLLGLGLKKGDRVAVLGNRGKTPGGVCVEGATD